MLTPTARGLLLIALEFQGQQPKISALGVSCGIPPCDQHGVLIGPVALPYLALLNIPWNFCFVSFVLPFFCPNSKPRHTNIRAHKYEY